MPIICLLMLRMLGGDPVYLNIWEINSIEVTEPPWSAGKGSTVRVHDHAYYVRGNPEDIARQVEKRGRECTSDY